MADQAESLYSSAVVVDFEKSPANLVRQFKLLADLISDRTITIAREKNHMDFARLDFEIDKRNLGGGQVAVSKFILEDQTLHLSKKDIFPPLR
jgi:hypothetical protein